MPRTLKKLGLDKLKSYIKPAELAKEDGFYIQRASFRTNKRFNREEIVFTVVLSDGEEKLLSLLDTEFRRSIADQANAQNPLDGMIGPLTFHKLETDQPGGVWVFEDFDGASKKKKK
jgi:hypothetical protein